MEDFSIVNDNLKLNGTIISPSTKHGSQPAILFVHGWTAERTRSFQYANALAELGYICLLFDMRGHGTSEGSRDSYTSREFLSDVVAAYDHLTTIAGVDTSNISAIGSSFGGFLLPLLARERSVRNLVMRAPADYPKDQFDTAWGLPDPAGFNIVEWRKELRDTSTSYALEALQHFNGNVLLIESEKDERIPHQTILNYMSVLCDPNKVTHVLIKDAPHSIKEGKFRDEVTRILVEWFRHFI